MAAPPTPKTICVHCVETLENHAGTKCLYGPTWFDYFCCLFCKQPIEDTPQGMGTIVTLEGEMNYLAHNGCMRRETYKLRTELRAAHGGKALSWDREKKETVRRWIKEHSV